jgi:formamidopyrimidine-DNA glycosylase
VPELPEVETIVRDLRPELQGCVILSAEVYWPRTVATSTVLAFQQRIAGQRVEAVGRRGKYVTLRLCDGDWLLIHLKMTGRLEVMPEHAAPDKYVRAVLRLDDRRQLLFRDPRKFGRLHLTCDPEGILGALGPEPLADDFTLEAFDALLRRRRGRLKPLLLNQHFVAGLGTIYADESLFTAGLHPQRTADSLSDAEIAGLYHAIRCVLRQGVENRGTTLSDRGYRDAKGRAGGNQAYVRVYGRAGEPCTRCGAPVERIVLSGRSTHFCPQCQAL